MVSTSGSQLLPESAVQTLIDELLPVTTILTPNIPEALLILKTANKPCKDPQSVEDIVQIAKDIQALGPKYVLVKGGHVPLTKDRLVSSTKDEKHVVLNVLCSQGDIEFLETPYVESDSTHGTGCSLACKSRAMFSEQIKHTNIASCHCLKHCKWAARVPVR
jgi:ATP-dependent RNA helicase DDX5/DBP2